MRGRVVDPTSPTFDPSKLNSGDVLSTDPGFDMRQHQADKREHEADARRAFLATAKRLTVRVAPAVFDRFEALMARRKPWPKPYREQVLAWVVSLGLDVAERSENRAARSRARSAARHAQKGGAA